MFVRTVLVAAFALAPVASPVQAAELPSEPVLLHLKDFETLPLVWTGDGAALHSEGHHWLLKPIEALHDRGAHLIVHEDTGQCLGARPLPADGDTAPLELVDCVDAEPWEIVHDDAAGHDDYRFVTPDGLLLGIERQSQADRGSAVMAVDVDASQHAQEWRLAAESGPEAPPTEQTPSPSESPSPGENVEAPTTDPVAATLPSTGPGLAVAVSGGVVAVAAGAVAVIWWRRRALRSHW
ncbi:hypothetical protein [Glycomyces buryatensis]|nr:hypothetical protein [Glycomyces buryatensis]